LTPTGLLMEGHSAHHHALPRLLVLHADLSFPIT
jgi:hypothetical protein